jgi:hypothetical protein
MSKAEELKASVRWQTREIQALDQLMERETWTTLPYCKQATFGRWDHDCLTK